MTSDGSNNAAMVMLVIALVSVICIFVYTSATDYSQNTVNTPSETGNR